MTSPGDAELSVRFAAAMSALGPFETSPHLAAAVSGGPDSMALAWLLSEWMGRTGGRLAVLCVDHGLRADSADDCAFVAGTLGQLPGVTVEVFQWTGERPRTSIQEAARDARYRLLAGRCRELGIVHLLAGHTLDDQAETLAMRRAHGSGPAGLAGMAAIRSLSGVRLLRPLLGLRRIDLSHWLAAHGRPWRNDPGNLSDRFERVRHRRAIADSGSAPELAAEALAHGRQRDSLERAAARLFAEAVRIDSAGYAEIDVATWERHTADMRRQALGALLVAIGGARYRPSLTGLARLCDLFEGSTRSSRTLGGCVVQRRRLNILVCRETTQRLEIRDGEGPWAGIWDARFKVTVARPTGHWSLKALGENGLEQLSRRHGMVLRRCAVPLAARKALPALWCGEDVVAVPQLGWGRGLRARFRPEQSVTGGGFPVADFGLKPI